MKKGYFTALKGNADEGYDWDTFIEYKFKRFQFEKTQIVKIDGEEIDGKKTKLKPISERDLMLSSTKGLKGKAELSGEIPTKEQFVQSELKKIREWPDPDPDNTFIFNMVPKYKVELEKRLLSIGAKKPKKPYKSLRRVIAFYILLLHENDQLSQVEIESKNQIRKRVDEVMGGELKKLGTIDSLTVYLTIRSGYKDESALYKNKNSPSQYKIDSDFALKLFQYKYGDSIKPLPFEK